MLRKPTHSPTMKETLASIAARIGVSTTTISRVLSGKADKYRISAQTVERVLVEVQKCNYTPSALAQSLRKNKTHTIGLILPTIANPYFADMASAIIAEARDKDYTTIIVDSMEDEVNQRHALTTLLARKVDGIIAAPCGSDPRFFEEIRKTVPLVLVDRYFENSRIPYVTANNYRGAFEATELLVRNGHRNIACIQGDIDSVPNKARVKGYQDALRKIKPDAASLIVGDAFSIQNGYLETKLLLSRTPRPTAIFALSFTILLGALKAIRDTSFRIPEDISLIAFDNHVSLDYMTPPMTRVSQPVEEMGKLASKLLFDYIENKTDSITQLELATTIISKSSIVPVKEG